MKEIKGIRKEVRILEFLLVLTIFLLTSLIFIYFFNSKRSENFLPQLINFPMRNGSNRSDMLTNERLIILKAEHDSATNIPTGSYRFGIVNPASGEVVMNKLIDTKNNGISTNSLYNHVINKLFTVSSRPAEPSNSDGDVCIEGYFEQGCESEIFMVDLNEENPVVKSLLKTKDLIFDSTLDSTLENGNQLYFLYETKGTNERKIVSLNIETLELEDIVVLTPEQEGNSMSPVSDYGILDAETIREKMAIDNPNTEGTFILNGVEMYGSPSKSEKYYLYTEEATRDWGGNPDFPMSVFKIYNVRTETSIDLPAELEMSNFGIATNPWLTIEE